MMEWFLSINGVAWALVMVQLFRIENKLGSWGETISTIRKKCKLFNGGGYGAKEKMG